VNSSELKRAKRRVRREVIAIRDAIPAPRRAELAVVVADRFLALPEVRAASTVMVFWSFGSELSTEPIIEGLLARGATVALPRIVEHDLEVRTWRPGEPVTETAFGAWEPAGGRRLAPQELDVVATPAVAFDRAGARIGYGGGFYDRFFPLSRPDAFRAGVGFGAQLVEGDLPGGGFDQRLDAVVTESETVRCPRLEQPFNPAV
jgi:5-formyltetrahydrofolate cyclo-ligase